MNNVFSKDIKAFVFDIDNTLVDTSKLFVIAYEEFKNVLLDVYGDEERVGEIYEELQFDMYKKDGRYRHTLDMEYVAEDFVGRIAKKDNLSLGNKVRLEECFKNIYSSVPDHLDSSFDVLNLVYSKGFKIVFWTHSGSDWGRLKMEDILSNTDIPVEEVSLFSVDLESKKDSNSLINVMNSLELKPNEIVVVGDNMVSDMTSAVDAGVKDVVWFRSGSLKGLNYKDNSIKIEDDSVDMRIIDGLNELFDLVDRS